MAIRLNGWGRLGVVLSVLWLGGVNALVLTEYWQRDKGDIFTLDVDDPLKNSFFPDRQIFFYWKSPRFFDFLEYHVGEDLGRFPEKQQLEILRKRDALAQELELRFNYLRYFGVLFIPVAVAWILVYFVVVTVRWVRRGFKEGLSGR